MRRIIACVIVGLVTVIAIYLVKKVNRSTHTSTNMSVSCRAIKSVGEKVVLYFPLPVSFMLYE
jgi:hypothetical protein